MRPIERTVQRITTTLLSLWWLVPLAATPTSLAAQPAVVVGRVVDATDRPIASVTVLLDDSELSTQTDDTGRFAFVVDFVDSGTVTVRKLGYAPATTSVRLRRGDTTRVVAQLASATLLDTVRATVAAAVPARLAGFEARRARGQGVFLTRAEFERRPHASTADVLRWSGAFALLDSGGAILPVSRRGTKNDRTRRTFDAPCVMRVAIDGIPMPDGFSLTQLPSPPDIAGIEIFRGPATMPAEFSAMRSSAFCGMVAVWTRSR